MEGSLETGDRYKDKKKEGGEQMFIKLWIPEFQGLF
jgi:hypothetical protein